MVRIMRLAHLFVCMSILYRLVTRKENKNVLLITPRALFSPILLP